jgi:hypothetical protein
MRDWDVLTQVAREQQSSSSASNTANTNIIDKQKKKEPENTQKSLPNMFVSHRHYIAALALLYLAEARAQLVLEATGDLSRRSSSNCFVPVTVQTTKRDSSTLDCLTVKVSQPRGSAFRVSCNIER